MSYKHFNEIEIYAIDFYLKIWYKIKKIAEILWRDRTSISRTIKKYSDENWNFSSEYCIEERKRIQSEVNSKNRQRIEKWSWLEKFILEKIKETFSPEQIAWRWREETWEKLSKDTVYKYIYDNHPEIPKDYFRRQWKKYKHKRKEKYQIKERKMIEERNKKFKEQITERSEIWHWEADTVLWLRWWSKKVILTNVERKSWFLLSTMIENKTWNAVMEWMIRLFKDIPEKKKISITSDNWREFCEYKKIEEITKLDFYFANPYHSRERWTNENTNWLIRQFFPKKTDFSDISEKDLQYVVNLINLRPRKRLNYKTPYEVFFNVNLNMCTSF